MTKLTRERLEEIAELARKATYKPCAMHMTKLLAVCDSEVIEEMARQLLAGLEQEPVAKRLRYKDGPWLYKQIGEDGPAECYTEQMLYAAPQLPQPAVMTPYYSRFLSDVMTAAGLLSHGKRDKALATRLADSCVAQRMEMDAPCRTAMLKGSHRDLSHPVDPQVAAYEKIMEQAMPDGWVAVPVEPTEDMVIAGFEAELREEFRNPESWEAFEAMSGCEQAAHRAKWCWAAMIAAVPQQEAE